jgi:hypothetical protein
MKVKVEGIKELDKALGRYVKALGHAFQQASADAADTFLHNTDVYVKYETGALRASGIWFQENDGFRTETIIGYGAQPEFAHYRVFPSGRTVLQEPEKYAARQHDDIESALEAGTQWKWMDHGVDMFQSIMVGLIVEEMSRV